MESVTQQVRASFSADRQAAMSIHLRMGPMATVFSLLHSADVSTWHMRTRVLLAGEDAILGDVFASFKAAMPAPLSAIECIGGTSRHEFVDTFKSSNEVCYCVTSSAL